MGRKRQKGKAEKDNRGAPKATSVSFEIGADADQAFLDAMNTLDLTQIPAKDTKKDGGDEARKPAAPRGKSDGPAISIDLHGYTLREALDVVGNRIAQLLARESGTIHVRVVTGKGRHSGSEGSVLAKEVHKYVVQRFQKSIQRIDSAPADVMVGNLPIRGHFDILLRGQ